MPIGGYNEFGKNMTAVKIDDSVIILDMGLHVEKYISFNGEDNKIKFSRETLIKEGIIPDDSIISAWKNKVKAIIPSHAHLDHIGAIQFLAKNYKAPILCTPYTAEVIKVLTEDEGHKIKNTITILNSNETFNLSPDLKIEFIHMTHSIPHTVMVAIHTKYGTILYANDFKFDNFPVLGKKPNYGKLKRIGENGVIALIADGTGAMESQKTPSESVAREMLKDLLVSDTLDCRNIIVTTFSSHIARLKSIIEYAIKIGRRPVLLGRSMSKYVLAAENIELVDFSKHVEIYKYQSQVSKFLKNISKQRSQKKYLLICTGHQGEERAVLGKIAYGEIKFDLNENDCIIFSSRVIPTKTNEHQWDKLITQLKYDKVRIFSDVHVSGHASREDHRYLIELVKPKHLIPAHGSKEMTLELVKLAKELGYDSKHVHHVVNGELLEL